MPHSPKFGENLKRLETVHPKNKINITPRVECIDDEVRQGTEEQQRRLHSSVRSHVFLVHRCPVPSEYDGDDNRVGIPSAFGADAFHSRR